MSRQLYAALVYSLALGVSCVLGEDAKVANPQRLPQPLEGIVADLAPLSEHFQVIETKLYPADQFTVGGRIVAEETIVWTLEAKAAIKGGDVYKLLHANPAPSPFWRARFFKTVDGQEVAADARPKGYALIGDRRWLSATRGPDLAKGDRLEAWVHLGKEGSAGLIERQATRMVVAK